MASTAASSSKVPADQVRKAVVALLAHLKKKSEESSTLLDGDEDISLVFSLRKIPDKSKNKPISIPIPNSIYGRQVCVCCVFVGQSICERLSAPRVSIATYTSRISHACTCCFLWQGVRICLFTKDPQKEYEQKLAADPVANVKEVRPAHWRELAIKNFIRFIHCYFAFPPPFPPLFSFFGDGPHSLVPWQVIAISKLRTEHKQFEDKRELLSNFDLFLADDRIIPLLPPLLGIKFFKKKKYRISSRPSVRSAWMPFDFYPRNDFTNRRNPSLVCAHLPLSSSPAGSRSPSRSTARARGPSR